MRFRAGKKTGQSGSELLLAVFFSLFLHAALVSLALVLRMAITSRTYVPPFYEVKLVAMSPAPAAVPKTPPAPEKPKPAEPKKKQPVKPPKASPKKSTMPELTREIPKPAPQKPAPQEEPEQPAAPPAAPEQPAEKADGVAMPTTSEDFKFPPYLAVVRDKIERNWNPPPGVKGIKAQVQFTVLRSGRVSDANLEESSGNFYFDQAAVRAILLSSPFPRMPDGFYKESAVFRVDLQKRD